jgi:hypothetical protein
MFYVRRLFCALGAAYFAFALLVPMLAAFQAESRVPLCCRRHGAHHCSMGMTLPGENVTTAGHCPQWPRAVTTATTQDFVTRSAQTSIATLPLVALVRVRNADAGRIARERQLSLRGPPTILFA